MIILYTLKLNKVFHRIPNFNLIDSLFFFSFFFWFCFVLSLRQGRAMSPWLP